MIRASGFITPHNLKDITNFEKSMVTCDAIYIEEIYVQVRAMLEPNNEELNKFTVLQPT